MKIGKCMFKIAAAIFAMAAAICCVIAFWDKIEEGSYRVRQRMAARRCGDPDTNDYEDWVD